MKPIINPWLFYIVDCLDGLKILCILAVPLLVFVIGYITITIDDFERGDGKELIRTRNIVILFSISILIVIPFIPSKETCYKMMVASQITDNNIQKAEDTIKNSVDYIFEKINER